MLDRSHHRPGSDTPRSLTSVVRQFVVRSPRSVAAHSVRQNTSQTILTTGNDVPETCQSRRDFVLLATGLNLWALRTGMGPGTTSSWRTRAWGRVLHLPGGPPVAAHGARQRVPDDLHHRQRRSRYTPVPAGLRALSHRFQPVSGGQRKRCNYAVDDYPRMALVPPQGRNTSRQAWRSSLTICGIGRSSSRPGTGPGSTLR